MQKPLQRFVHFTHMLREHLYIHSKFSLSLPTSGPHLSEFTRWKSYFTQDVYKANNKKVKLSL
jgi:hypothetical protein